MTTLCPVCNNTLDRKRDEVLGEDLLRCRVCRQYTVEGAGVWTSDPSIDAHIRLKKQRDDDKARYQLMIESDINHPMWTRIYL